eukprot:GHVO01034481.1.p3 GENE.GHVO01034481.1~~GHVO01034481.1.p3  ORF type:complete len:120 (-),score=8.72 GHVO01034481.1:497-856(-)
MTGFAVCFPPTCLKYGLWLELQKCQFFQKETYLGFIISQSQIKDGLKFFKECEDPRSRQNHPVFGRVTSPPCRSTFAATIIIIEFNILDLAAASFLLAIPDPFFSIYIIYILWSTLRLD